MSYIGLFQNIFEQIKTNKISTSTNLWAQPIWIHEKDMSEYDKCVNEIVTNGHMDKWNTEKW